MMMAGVLHRWWYAAILAAFVLISVLVMFPVKHSRSQVTLLQPTATSVALAGTGTVVSIVGANPTRRLIQICNPSAIVETIAPTGITPANASNGVTLPAVASGVTSCYSTPLGVSSAGAAWSAVSASGTPNIVVFEFF